MSDNEKEQKVGDIRFNKFEPHNFRIITLANKGNVKFPLRAADYPVREETATVLRCTTTADSVVVPGDVQLPEGEKEHSYWKKDPITHAVIDPVYPGDKDGDFWHELKHVVDVQIARVKDNSISAVNTMPEFSKNFVLPAIWKERGFNLEDVARAVQGEYPASVQATFIETVYKNGGDIDSDLCPPFRSQKDFIGKQVRMAAINTWAFEAVAPLNFKMKWNIGMPRPEEMAWKISIGGLTTSRDGVPEDLVASIKSMRLKNQYDFTAYKKTGSPTHPSFPAMHSAGSTCSLWLPALYEITDEQYCEALRVDFAVSYGRTVAGVHYAQDNLAGLNLGQRIIRENLPAFLKRYGYDEGKVKTRLKKLSFDWNTFDGAACTINGVPAGEFLRAGLERGTKKAKHN